MVGWLIDGVVDTGFGVSDDHHTAVVIDDLDRNLPTHAGTAPTTTTFFASKCISRSLPSCPSRLEPDRCGSEFGRYDTRRRELRRSASAVPIQPRFQMD
jgi:hypothetical protein